MKFSFLGAFLASALSADAITPSFPPAMNVTEGFEHLPKIPKGENIVKLPARTSKIIDGSEVSEAGKYPWYSLLQYDFGGSYSWAGCGGTLVSPEFILTAAHCINEYTSSFGAVWIGALTLDDGNGGQYSEIINNDSVFIHPLWDPERVSGAIFDGDYALLKLATPSSITPLNMDGGISDGYTSSEFIFQFFLHFVLY